MKKLLLFLSLCFLSFSVIAQSNAGASENKTKSKAKIQYGIASYYSSKFNGRKTSNGEIFSQQKMTGAHNSLPLGTYVRVTNLKNGKSIIVKINDRLHHKNKRIIDLTRGAATKLGYITHGLTRVKLEVLGKNLPK